MCHDTCIHSCSSMTFFIVLGCGGTAILDPCVLWEQFLKAHKQCPTWLKSCPYRTFHVEASGVELCSRSVHTLRARSLPSSWALAGNTVGMQLLQIFCSVQSERCSARVRLVRKSSASWRLCHMLAKPVQGS